MRNPATWSRAALMVAYLGLMAALAGVAWETAKIDLSGVAKVFTALAAGLMGAVINPATSKQAQKGLAQPQQPTIDAMWAAHAVIGCAALLVAAAALVVDGGRHVNASDAFVAMATAFGMLFVDTSSATHALAPAASPAPATAAAPATAPAASPAAEPVAATASGSAQTSTPNASA
ncbi:hypothetical protein [Streptacidiphilus fuscans]|uniref:Uncharacterized protein n=1 Tax=Streptacidiphilus fuscans TaxID=2789292 RepID=A0A931B5K8_9ACTN|nr:hypothetical protein [Streptacidiphilus fuscans]MBF9069421.1 hypothetical protein [Streptacidiphilus fuscans]